MRSLGQLAAKPQKHLLHRIAGGVFITERSGGKPQEADLELIDRLQHPSPAIDAAPVASMSPLPVSRASRGPCTF